MRIILTRHKTGVVVVAEVEAVVEVVAAHILAMAKISILSRRLRVMARLLPITVSHQVDILQVSEIMVSVNSQSRKPFKISGDRLLSYFENCKGRMDSD